MAIGLSVRKKPEEPIPVRAEETRRWFESGTVSTDMVKGLSMGVTLEELTKMCTISRSRKLEEMVGDSHVTGGLQSTKDACGVTLLATSEESAPILPKHSRTILCISGTGG